MARLSHLALRVRDLDRMQGFYVAVLGLRPTDRGISARRGQEIAFLSGEPGLHHALALVAGAPPRGGGQALDHLAFAVGTLDALRDVRDRALAAGGQVRSSDHGNAWSVYVTDPEGNHVEVFVPAPFAKAQPYGRSLDLDRADAEILAATRAICDAP